MTAGIHPANVIYGAARGSYKKKKAVRKRHRQTTLPDRYPTTYGEVLKGMEPGAGGLGQTMQTLMENYSGGAASMDEFLRRMSPFLAASQFQTEPYKYLADFQNLDKSMGAYQSGAERIGRGAGQAGRAGRAAVGGAGLGGSGAGGALEARAAQSGGVAQSNLFTDMYQRREQNVNRYAMDAFENERMITQMALGGLPYPRTRSASRGLGQSIGSSIGMLGGLIGQQFGQGTPGVTQLPDITARIT